MRGGLIPRSKGVAATDAEISSGETHPQPAMKADVAGGGAPAFAAPSKSGGSELFDALLMAATGALINMLLGRTMHKIIASLPLNSLCNGRLSFCFWSHFRNTLASVPLGSLCTLSLVAPLCWESQAAFTLSYGLNLHTTYVLLHLDFSLYSTP